MVPLLDELRCLLPFPIAVLKAWLKRGFSRVAPSVPWVGDPAEHALASVARLSRVGALFPWAMLMCRVGPAMPILRSIALCSADPWMLVRWAPVLKAKDLGSPGGSIPGLSSETVWRQRGHVSLRQNQPSLHEICKRWLHGRRQSLCPVWAGSVQTPQSPRLSGSEVMSVRGGGVSSSAMVTISPFWLLNVGSSPPWVMLAGPGDSVPAMVSLCRAGCSTVWAALESVSGRSIGESA